MFITILNIPNIIFYSTRCPITIDNITYHGIMLKILFQFAKLQKVYKY